ncbi:glutaredoxin family protein [Metabacillus sp. GX 13764]|uniref:glutaredoxin family protein n=1 Tax=Metabacillus kandeliae TaxID=2900151 RepID=UPI001E57B32C|nr:glutaredoxin family protein [Metabacillus kandeliae]MCD7035717.1 glutaredoxin family protein [Metabacillus kandeliae]
MKKITLYSKKGCHLCEDAERLLEDLLKESPFELTIVDIYSDDELLSRYQLMIPVLFIDGKEAGYGAFEKDFISKRLHEKE